MGCSTSKAAAIEEPVLTKPSELPPPEKCDTPVYAPSNPAADSEMRVPSVVLQDAAETIIDSVVTAALMAAEEEEANELSTEIVGLAVESAVVQVEDEELAAAALRAREENDVCHSNSNPWLHVPFDPAVIRRVCAAVREEDFGGLDSDNGGRRQPLQGAHAAAVTSRSAQASRGTLNEHASTFERLGTRHAARCHGGGVARPSAP